MTKKLLDIQPSFRQRHAHSEHYSKKREDGQCPKYFLPAERDLFHSYICHPIPHSKEGCPLYESREA